MRLSAILKEIRTISDLSPRMRGQLNVKTKDGKTCGEKWATIIAGKHLNPVDFENTVYAYAHGERAIPESVDELMRSIITETADKTAEDERRAYQQQMYHQRPDGAMAAIQSDPIGCYAVQLGKQCRDGVITKAENAERMDELFMWEAGGPKPNWIGGE